MMPIYEYECPLCMTIAEDIRGVPHADDRVLCGKCGAVTHRISPTKLGPIKMPGGIHGIVDYGDGDYARVHSEADLKSEAKKRGLVVNEL